jgi:CRP-like cAMP-binding protein
MLTWQDPHKNLLLRKLPEVDYARIEPDLELVRLQAGQVLMDAHVKPVWGYFPINCLLSLVGMSSEGQYTPIAEIGEDGLAGAVGLLGGKLVPYSCVTLVAGHACRIRIDRLLAEFNRQGRFQQIALEYAQLLMIQVAQSAICLRRHSTEQKICKLLVQSVDRSMNNELEMTQQFIGNMLGLRREDVTHAARKLQDEKLLDYTRGRITILDRDAIAARSCECYGLTKGDA